MPLVLVRTPTYRRPDMLRRAMACLQAQTHTDWICEVRDDCPEGSAQAVVEDIADPRIRYVQNRPQKFMVRNLDDCFLKDNPYKADYFYMLEDDNQILPQFMARGSDILEQEGVAICQINQMIEYNSRTPQARIGEDGIFDEVFEERVHSRDEMHLAMFGATGISNGAVFWSRHIVNELAIRVDTIPTLEEYLRTALVAERVYITREKLAVWAQNEQSTNRNLGLRSGWLQRELALKSSITALQRAVWASIPGPVCEAFLNGGILRIPLEKRREALRKAGIWARGVPSDPSLKARGKRLAVRHLTSAHASVGVVMERMAGQMQHIIPG